ncbi:MAG: hypothetical protein COA96_12230 [SAR86 cluster bacterium]|uniref:DinB-like domain-containing protein n=1 Tax=SAR86 cluster bacterium TaxID=2030880 RepID=A0A2A5AVA4_9GAMM|nr:MAG: hypothetical protein COA96_12230 [SAR86 cluster bacterium]
MKLMTNSKTISQTGKADLAQDHSESLLIQGCLHCVSQCDELMAFISDELYTAESQGNSSIGAHTRHILDRFHCFFAGLQGAYIDYDDRKRDKTIENSIEAAAFALASVAARVEKLNLAEFADTAITVSESVYHKGPAMAIPSTVNRELMGLITHSIHHLAIIAIIARSFGCHMDEDFGKAPSTIVYEHS